MNISRTIALRVRTTRNFLMKTKMPKVEERKMKYFGSWCRLRTEFFFNCQFLRSWRRQRKTNKNDTSKEKFFCVARLWSALVVSWRMFGEKNNFIFWWNFKLDREILTNYEVLTNKDSIFLNSIKKLQQYWHFIIYEGSLTLT